MTARPVAVATAKPSSTREPVLIDFALQGGGSHGAYTWGVLDRLLEEPWLRIEGVSGTSAGAMNAAVLVAGHAAGGAEGAPAARRSGRKAPGGGVARWAETNGAKASRGELGNQRPRPRARRGASDAVMPGTGLEPVCPCGQRFLRPPRIPFRHPGATRGS